MCLNPAPHGHAIDWMARPVRIIRCVEGNRSESPEVQGGTRRPQATDYGACGLYPNGRVFSMSYMPHDESRPFLPAPRRSGRDVSWSTRYESRLRPKARPASAVDRFPGTVPDLPRCRTGHQRTRPGAMIVKGRAALSWVGRSSGRPTRGTAGGNERGGRGPCTCLTAFPGMGRRNSRPAAPSLADRTEQARGGRGPGTGNVATVFARSRPRLSPVPHVHRAPSACHPLHGG